MNTKTVVRRPYVRPMQGWWRRDPAFMRYMLRESTALALLAYAIVLLVGVVRLAQGEAAWNGWLAALQAPWAVVLNFVLLIAMFVHTWTWFGIMPKVMSTMVVGGRRVSDHAITLAGWIAAVVASIALFALASWWRT